MYKCSHFWVSEFRIIWVSDATQMVKHCGLWSSINFLGGCKESSHMHLFWLLPCQNEKSTAVLFREIEAFELREFSQTFDLQYWTQCAGGCLTKFLGRWLVQIPTPWVWRRVCGWLGKLGQVPIQISCWWRNSVTWPKENSRILVDQNVWKS